MNRADTDTGREDAEEKAPESRERDAALKRGELLRQAGPRA